jgi:hypothetical protein
VGKRRGEGGTRNGPVDDLRSESWSAPAHERHGCLEWFGKWTARNGVTNRRKWRPICRPIALRSNLEPRKVTFR